MDRKLTRYFNTRKFCSGSLFLKVSFMKLPLASVGSSWNRMTSSKRSNVRSGSGSSRKKAFSKTATRWTSVWSSNCMSSPELTFACTALIWATFAERRKIPSVSKCPGADRNSTHFVTMGGIVELSLFTDIQLSGAPNWQEGSGVDSRGGSNGAGNPVILRS